MQEMQHEKTLTGLNLINHINNFDQVTPSVMFLRHGDRDKIPDGQFGDEVELNEKGILNSISFGRSISHLMISGIYSSPIKRCVQTAEMIKSGLEKDIPITITNHLGDPGPFVYHNNKAAGESYLLLGGFGLMDRLIDGEPVPGFRTIEEGTDILNRLFIEKSKEPGTNIYISHDLIIALYSWGAFKNQYTKDNWVKYLSGAFIQIGHDGNKE